MDAEKIKMDKAALNVFVLKSVRDNVIFPVQGTGPVTSRMSIQQLIHEASIGTLERYFEWLNNQPNKGSSRRSKAPNYYAGKFTHQDVAEAVDIILAIREFESESRKLQKQLDDIDKEIASLETNDERRERLKKQKAQLESVVAE